MPDFIPAVGELEICPLCDNSPHAVLCPHHPDYDDDHVSYTWAGETDEYGPASLFVDATFAQAARDLGVLREVDALREGIAEFRAALERGEIRRVR
jgi:hypothetical protein